jgi:type II secretory pathway predicted ATPase ExeA
MGTDPEFLWQGEKHKEALAVLKYAILENKGVLVLTGDVGTGKTTLINALLKSLGEDTITATIYDARLEVLDFFNTVAAAFKIKETFEGKGKFVLRFMDFLIKAHERKKKVLLIIDEAQGINEDLLEEIRLLSNLEAEYTRLLNIFFVGQNEFVDILQKYENRALRQRVTIRYHIDPLTLNETAAYIRHRLEVSGCESPVFDSGAIDEIFYFSGGYPRLINIMCDHALLTGYVREVNRINANLIRECREELLVSKKTSEKDFEYSAGNQQVLPREPVIPDPSKQSFVNVRDSEPPAEKQRVHPEEPMAPDPSKQPFVYVRDSQPPEDEKGAIGPQHSLRKPASPRKIKKKRFFRFSSIMIFLLVAGVGAAYFFYGNNHDKAESYATNTQQQDKKYFSVKAESKNDNPSMVQARPETSDIPKQVQSGKVEGSRFFTVDSSKTGSSKAPVPKKTESFQPAPSRTFSQDAGAASLSDTSESADKIYALNETEKDASVAKLTKEAAPTATQDSDAAGLGLSPKSPSLAAVPSDPKKKKFVVSPVPTIRQDDGKVSAPDPAIVHSASKDAESAKKEVVKPEEKPETTESATQPVQSQNKAKEPEALKQAEPERKPAVAASVSSEKQVTAPVEKSWMTRPEKTVVSEAGRPAERQTTIKEKTPPAFSVPGIGNTDAPDQKKPMDRSDEKTDEKTDKKMASLGVPVNKSEKAGKPAITHIGLMARLKSFLNEYCRTYEQKDLDKFSTFFAFNAVEKGKPFQSWLPQYRRNFDRIDSIEYDIEIKRYAIQEDTGQVKIDGNFHARAKLGGSKEWLKNSGQISMILEADGNSFKVRQLDY